MGCSKGQSKILFLIFLINATFHFFLFRDSEHVLWKVNTTARAIVYRPDAARKQYNITEPLLLNNRLLSHTKNPALHGVIPVTFGNHTKRRIAQKLSYYSHSSQIGYLRHSRKIKGIETDVILPAVHLNEKSASAYKFDTLNATDVQLIEPIFLINEPFGCTDDEQPDTFLLVLILSHPSNKVARNAIRDTWGSVSRRYSNGEPRIRVFFLLGSTMDNKLTSALVRESKLFRDIVQAGFVDAYQNLTMKTLMGLQWAEKFCPSAKLILKTDDDTMINTQRLMDVLRAYKQAGLILGSVNDRALVMRTGRWKLSREQFPAVTFPPYCNGAAYVLSADVAQAIVRRANHVPIVPLEDVYITGIMARKLGITPTSHPAFGFWTTRLDRPCDMIRKGMVSAHALAPETLYQLWSVISGKMRCI